MGNDHDGIGTGGVHSGPQGRHRGPRTEESAAPAVVAQQDAQRLQQLKQKLLALIMGELAPGASLSQATTAVEAARVKIGLPSEIHGGFQGTAQAFQSSLSSEPVLILLALVTVYIVLGMLYESLIHPITILSTLPSAGVGALVAPYRMLSL